MSSATSIEWTDATWNPVTGCTEVSAGCDRCYAKAFAERFRGVPGHYFERGFDVQLRGDKLGLPLRWRKPRKVFVNSMSDLFHEHVPDEFIAAVWVRMLWTSTDAAIRTYRGATAPCHTYQVLTKRPGRMRSWVRRWADPQQRTTWMRAAVHSGWCHPQDITEARNWPAVLPNVWLGVSVENQRWADVRIPLLMETPAAVRWLSCEPLLGPVDIHIATTPFDPPIDWVVAGGESGRGARPMDPDWARLIRNYCMWKNIPFLLKQWGEWTPAGLGIGIFRSPEQLVGEPVDEMGHRQIMRRVGKGRAGRELDGVVWDQYPERV